MPHPIALPHVNAAARIPENARSALTPHSVSEFDAKLIAAGRHPRLWEVLGAHPVEARVIAEPGGTRFSVYAPAARSISVIGEFNDWQLDQDVLRRIPRTNVWSVVVPHACPGQMYKFHIIDADGNGQDRADPFARCTEAPPANASIVAAPSGFGWTDGAWLSARSAAQTPYTQPLSIYEVHLDSWRPGLSYREIAHELGDYVLGLGFTHVEFMPLCEHPFAGSWGYQVTSYFAPTSRFGTPEDLRYLINHLHGLGIGVLLDWVPVHFATDGWALANFDGSPLFEYQDPQQRDQVDWGTYGFDLAKPFVRNFLVASATYWIEEFHVDGLRVDAVAALLYRDFSRSSGGWTPNEFGGRENLAGVEFVRELNSHLHQRFPGIITIAEESSAWPGVTRGVNVGGLGFTFTWNMGWMHDCLRYVGKDPIYRRFHHADLTFSLSYAWNEHYVLPVSHDEVVHGKGTLLTRMPGTPAMQAAGVRLHLAYQWAHPGKKLLFMGQEWGQRAEWSHELGLAWPADRDVLTSAAPASSELPPQAHRGIQTLTADLNRLYRSNPALGTTDATPGGFTWIDAHDSFNNGVCFLRVGGGHYVACIFNFSGVTLTGYRVGLPQPGAWCEALNTDSQFYGGANLGNLGQVIAGATPHHGFDYSAEVTIAALSAVWLVRC